MAMARHGRLFPITGGRYGAGRYTCEREWARGGSNVRPDVVVRGRLSGRAGEPVAQPADQSCDHGRLLKGVWCSEGSRPTVLDEVGHEIGPGDGNEPVVHPVA